MVPFSVFSSFALSQPNRAEYSVLKTRQRHHLKSLNSEQEKEKRDKKGRA